MFSALLLAIVLQAPPQEAPENPLFTSWAAHPVGTTVVLKTSTTIKGNPLPGGETRTIRLVSKTPDRVIVQEIHATVIEGEAIESDPERVEIRRTLAPGLKPEAPSDAGGEEELVVLGRTFPCRWIESKGQTEAGPSLSRTWLSNAMPGRIVRAVTRVPASQKETTIEVVELKIPGSSR